MSGTPELQEIMSRDPRDWFASHLGVGLERKTEIYLELSKSSALGDAAYWLQILFAAGIATLGLVLNSPAVIIGAMLISPLMGPILAAGLALATGDVVLGLRAVVNLTLSCILAVGFAVLLVGGLPFKEVTAEIVARTRPTTLDLFVALFSGAIGSIAICRPVRGVVTSIPGVAIAVALMPPLCVTGYGIGIAASVDANEGWRIASGGGLLFLTNLFAITFTAMLVFLSLHVDMETVREHVREWRDQDREMILFRSALKRLPASQGLRRIGSLPGRAFMISTGLLVIVFPLSRSMVQIKQEIVSRKHDNEVRQAATDLWTASFSQFHNGDPRSYISRVSTARKQDRLAVQLQVFTNKPCTPAERAAYVHDLASRLRRPDESIALDLIEVPTTTSEILSLDRGPVRPAPVEASLNELRDRFLSAVGSALADLPLPPPAELVRWQVETVRTDSLRLVLTYLSERDIDADGQALIVRDTRERLQNPSTGITFRRIDTNAGTVPFKPNQAAIGPSEAEALDDLCRTLGDEPSIQVDVQTSRRNGEPENLADARRTAIVRFLQADCGIDSTRIVSTRAASTDGKAVLVLARAGSPAG